MRRSSSVAILAVCIVLLGGTVLATAGSIAVGAWQPVWDRPDPTPNPNQPDPGGPGPGVPTGDVDYEQFLELVRAGQVRFVDQQERTLFVSTDFSGFNVEVPDSVDDVYGDIAAAAGEAGVPPPRFSLNGNELPIGETTYEDFLAEVSAGSMYGVTHEGDRLYYDTDLGRYEVIGFDPSRDVLADIKAAAAQTGVIPPAYTWYQPQ